MDASAIGLVLSCTLKPRETTHSLKVMRLLVREVMFRCYGATCNYVESKEACNRNRSNTVPVIGEIPWLGVSQTLDLPPQSNKSKCYMYACILQVACRMVQVELAIHLG